MSFFNNRCVSLMCTSRTLSMSVFAMAVALVIFSTGLFSLTISLLQDDNKSNAKIIARQCCKNDVDL